MKVATARAGGIEIRLYHRPGHERYAARHLEAARRSLETYGRLFGPYPWSILTIIDPPIDAVLAVGGMEYPTLITTGGAVDLGGGGERTRGAAPEGSGGLRPAKGGEGPFLEGGVNESTTPSSLDAGSGPAGGLAALPFLRLGSREEHRLSVDARELISPVAT